jgi:hypothetical protein
VLSQAGGAFAPQRYICDITPADSRLPQQPFLADTSQSKIDTQFFHGSIKLCDVRCSERAPGNIAQQVHLSRIPLQRQILHNCLRTTKQDCRQLEIESSMLILKILA